MMMIYLIMTSEINNTEYGRAMPMSKCSSEFEYGLKHRNLNRNRKDAVLEIRFSDPQETSPHFSKEHPGHETACREVS
jgi:hypothetical protein